MTDSNYNDPIWGFLKSGPIAWNEYVALQKRPFLIKDVRFPTGKYTNYDFSGIAWHNVHFGGTTFEDCDFSGCDFREGIFVESAFVSCKFNRAHTFRTGLEGVSVSSCSIQESQFHIGKWMSVSFYSCDISLTRFSRLFVDDFHDKGSVFRSCGYFDTKFFVYEFINTSFNDVEFGSVSFAGGAFTNSSGLETCHSHSSCFIDMVTLTRSTHLPSAFLRQCHVPEQLVEYLPSLIGTPIAYFSCFLSHSTKDTMFVELLQKDLEGKGVDCWYWKEDARWGVPLMQSIDEAIRIYDRVIVVCSKASLESPAVTREIERALQREDQSRRRGEAADILFPIRLDDFIFEWKHQRQSDVVTKFIGDFTHWSDPFVYAQQLNKLVSDLKTS